MRWKPVLSAPQWPRAARVTRKAMSAWSENDRVELPDLALVMWEPVLRRAVRVAFQSKAAERQASWGAQRSSSLGLLGWEGVGWEARAGEGWGLSYGSASPSHQVIFILYFQHISQRHFKCCHGHVLGSNFLSLPVTQERN